MKLVHGAAVWSVPSTSAGVLHSNATPFLSTAPTLDTHQAVLLVTKHGTVASVSAYGEHGSCTGCTKYDCTGEVMVYFPGF